MSACNAVAFFSATQQAISAGTLLPPPLGTAKDGLACPTTRDFFIVDQDQSDNVVTTYLADGCGNTAQNTTANGAQFFKATILANGSDNRLLTLVDKAIGCTPWMVPDLTGGPNTDALVLNELQAGFAQQAPWHLFPSEDPMAAIGGEVNNQHATASTTKMNLLRASVGQPPNILSENARYCQNLYAIAAPRILGNHDALTAAASPAPATADNLYHFMANRFMATFGPPDGAGAESAPVAAPIS